MRWKEEGPGGAAPEMGADWSGAPARPPGLGLTWGTGVWRPSTGGGGGGGLSSLSSRRAGSCIPASPLWLLPGRGDPSGRCIGAPHGGSLSSRLTEPRCRKRDRVIVSTAPKIRYFGPCEQSSGAERVVESPCFLASSLPSFLPPPGRREEVAAMALGLFRVCLVVVTAIINHPLLFPRENATVPENEEEIIRQMQAHQEKLQLEQLRLEEEMARLAADKEAEKEALERVAEEGQQQNENRTAWDLWSTLCMILFLVIEVWRQDHQDAPSPECLGSDEDELPDLQGAPLRGLTLPNRATLDHFYERCIRGATADAARTREFVEGFVDDLLEALRSLCSRDSDMEVEDFIGVDSMYENWQVNKPLLCDLFVPFMPPEPYHFHPELWCSSRSVPLDRQGYGQIKVVRADEDTLGCICGKTKLGEDMLCLLHGRNNVVRRGSKVADPLCAPDSPYLDTMRVMKWFQTALTRAWHRIAHKYEFDLAFGQLDTPGSLKIRFRSGKFMPFNLIPVIQCDDSDLYFVSHLAREPSEGTQAPSTDWLLSFAVYERHFLRVTSKALPDGACHLSCLQIASFLLSKQSRLTGPSGLGNYHLKTALLHLLLARRPADWKAEQLDARLHELLCFLEKSLLEKKLQHFFIGNRKVPEAMGLPEAVRRAEPLNLFRPFVLQRSLYRKTVDSFYEMLKNAPALISEYSLHITSDHVSLPPKTVIL